jgi:hypothetical protein
MKKIIYLVLIAIVALSFNSCEDSLGIEDNYKKVYFDDDGNGNGGNGDPPDTAIARINPSEIVSNFTESLNYKNLGFSENYQFIPKKFSLDMIEIDTSFTPPYIWLDNLYIENKETVGYYEALRRKEYVKAVHLKLDSIKAEGFYYLNGEFSSNKFSKIEVFDIENNRTLTYSGADTKLNINFELISKERIQMNLHATIPSEYDENIDIDFYGFFIIIYKK